MTFTFTHTASVLDMPRWDLDVDEIMRDAGFGEPSEPNIPLYVKEDYGAMAQHIEWSECYMGVWSLDDQPT